MLSSGAELAATGSALCGEASVAVSAGAAAISVAVRSGAAEGADAGRRHPPERLRWCARADFESGVDTGRARECAAGRQAERERAEAGDGGEAVKREPIDFRTGLCCCHDVFHLPACRAARSAVSIAARE